MPMADGAVILAMGVVALGLSVSLTYVGLELFDTLKAQFTSQRH